MPTARDFWDIFAVTLARGIAGETIRALLVLALIFLNFGHGAMGSDGVRGIAALDTGVLCGEASPATPSLGGEPCPACRIASSIDLPPAPCVIVPAFGQNVAVAYEASVETGYRPAYGPIAGPRAPPAA